MEDGASRFLLLIERPVEDGGDMGGEPSALARRRRIYHFRFTRGADWDLVKLRQEHPGPNNHRDLRSAQVVLGELILTDPFASECGKIAQ